MYNLIYNCSWATKKRLRKNSHQKKKRCTKKISDNQEKYKPHATALHEKTDYNTIQHNATLCNRQQQKRNTRHTLPGKTRALPARPFCCCVQQTATHCNTLHHTSTHCNTLQRTAAHCHAVQTHCSSLQAASYWTQPWLVVIFFKWVCCLSVFKSCSILQCVAVCCSVLQCATWCCSVLQCVGVCCSVLQYVAVCCSVLQCGAVCCTVLLLDLSA
jgi:hypothetical protein